MFAGSRVLLDTKFKYVEPHVLVVCNTFDKAFEETLEECMEDLMDGDDEDREDRFAPSAVPKWPCPLPKTPKELQKLLPPNGHVMQFTFGKNIVWYTGFDCGNCVYRIESVLFK